MAEPERLLRADEELAALGKSDEDVEAVCARVAGVSANGLAAVDEQLEQLAAGVQLADLAGAVGQGAPASREELFQEAPWGEGGAEPEAHAGSPAGHADDALSAADLFGDAEAGSDSGPLTEEPSLSRPPPSPPPASSSIPAGEDYGGGLADLLEGEGTETEARTMPEAGQEEPDEEIEILETDEFELLVDDEDL